MSGWFRSKALESIVKTPEAVIETRVRHLSLGHQTEFQLSCRKTEFLSTKIRTDFRSTSDLIPQQPVATQTIIDAFVGFITGMGIATFVGRLIWPVLPQMIMRDDLLAILTHTKALLNAGPQREKIQRQLAILPAEALHASRQIRIAGCTNQEKARLGRLIRALQTLVIRTTGLVSRRHILPQVSEAILRPRFERLDLAFKQMLDAFAQCLRKGDCRSELPSLLRASSEMDGALEGIRQSEILNGTHSEALEHVLELVDRYHAIGEALEECRRLVGALKIHRYWGHCGL
jgi:hypothetical protein